MLALLEGERQALAALDIERITTCSNGKIELCERLDKVLPHELDEECLGLLDAVRRLNTINRRLRNLIATNVQSRIDAMAGAAGTYQGANGLSASQPV
ncbi:hypothetical protein DL238_05250 [Alteriqipengyuania lutimaris]|uniref:Flagellar protein FlgN n=2 Tax=Alteriqipengyuania lutimaris TaxID=1538146 RepID=A0A395LJ90_9SPHN|nr:hypothetical protein DL238_05250 [Alteriqipengyuania lutimaris]